MNGRRLKFAALVLAWMVGQPAAGADDGFVVIVAADSEVRQLASHVVADIYLGRAGRFPDGRLVEPIDQPEESGAKAAFYRAVLNRTVPQMRAHWSRVVFTGRGRPPHQARDSADVVRIVGRNPRAIGYVEPEFVDETVRVVRVVE